MSPLPFNFYARWREQCGAPAALRDASGLPPERLLQAIWQHQRLRRDRLHTLDGQAVSVLHPGFANPEGGPDFREAMIRIGEATPVRGDVEVDLRAGGWQAHGHDRNSNFRNVILHVVWDAGRSASTTPTAPVRLAGRAARNAAVNPPPPILPIKEALDAPLGEVARWLGGEAGRAFPESLRGGCCAPLHELAADRLRALLHEAAKVRLQSKAAWFQARARVAGWEQALWEGLFRALGYKHNAWPMQWLAERRTRWTEGKPSLLALQARLLGLSGLLPTELDREAMTGGLYVRKVWDQWWRERETYADCCLPRIAWRLNGLRPANHPQRRLMLATHWIAEGTLLTRLQHWCLADPQPADLAGSLLEVLQVENDEFWSWHWTFRSSRQAKPRPLLGGMRTADLALNVILPWLWMHAAESGNGAVCRAMEARYFAWPGAQDNAVLRLARKRLLGGAVGQALRGAAAQQGLLQILQDFCAHSNAMCDDCRFPELARAWQEGKVSGSIPRPG